MAKIITWMLKNYKTVLEAVLGLSVALFIAWGIMLHEENKKLTERLEMASNNIEAYEGVIAGNNEANFALQLTVEQLRNSNDSLILQIDSVIDANKIKPKQISTAATQTQALSVKGDKGVLGDLIEILKDTTYTDSIQYNPLTKVRYTIGKDTVSINIDLQNTQYIYTYESKEYKNKKSFIKRLLTLDFKKVKKQKYNIVNTNDLINTTDVRVIQMVK